MGTLDIIIVLGVVGSVASVVGVLIAAPTLKSRVIHISYGLCISVLAISLVTYQHRVTDAERRIAEMKSIEREAATLLVGFDFTTSGSMAGFMLAAMSFLEKHKERLPDTYARAVALCENSGCLKSEGSEGMEHFRSMQDASTSLKYLIQGVAKSGGN